MALDCTRVNKCHQFFYYISSQKHESEKERCIFSTVCTGCDHLTDAVAAAQTDAPLPYLTVLPWIHQ